MACARVLIEFVGGAFVGMINKKLGKEWGTYARYI